MDSEEAKLRRLEFQAEYVRHLNTLSTGSIVLITAFLEKLFPQPEWKPLIGVCLVSFLASVIGAVITYTLAAVTTEEEYPPFLSTIETVFSLMMWLGFIMGVAAVAIFALKNLF